jgi:hypothetical protein
MGANIGRPISDYRTLVETCRARADELELSRAEIDRISGLPEGYSGKLLSKGHSEQSGKAKKKMWPTSFELMLGALGLQVIIIEDPAATARTLAMRTPVDRSNQRFGNVCRISAKLLPPPQTDSPPPALSIVRTGTRRGGKYG